MRSRNSGSSKSTAPVSKMTPGKKNAASAKTAPTTSNEQASPTTLTPKSSDVKSGPMTRGKQIKSMETVTAGICSNKIPTETTPTGNFHLRTPSFKLFSVFLEVSKLVNLCNSMLLILLTRSCFFSWTPFDL